MHQTPCYSALIVDDENKPAEALKIKIIDTDPEIEVVGISNSSSDAIEKILLHEPDFIFLDIGMPGRSGLELVNTLQNCKKQYQVIITTAYDNVEYLQKALRLSVVDYLLKPIMKEELATAITKARHNLQNGPSASHKGTPLLDVALDKQNTFNCATGKLLLNASQIVYIKAEGNYCRFYLEDGTSEIVTDLMKNLEPLFQGTSLIRVDRSHIINRKHVQKLTNNSCLCYFTAKTSTKQIELTHRGIKALY